MAKVFLHPWICPAYSMGGIYSSKRVVHNESHYSEERYTYFGNECAHPYCYASEIKKYVISL